MFLKEVSYAHQGYTYLMKNTVKYLVFIVINITYNVFNIELSHDPSEII